MQYTTFKKTSISLILSFVLGIPLLLCGQQPNNIPEETTVKIKMLWVPQAQFAGYYMAQEEGLYQRAGLNVVLESPEQSEDIFQTLQQDQADFILAWSIPALVSASKGNDVVNIGQITQSSATLLIARKSSGIKKVEDISGHRVGIWLSPQARLPIIAFLQHHNIKDIKILPVLTNIDLFLYGGVDVIVGEEYNDVYRIYSSGIDPDELVYFRLKDTFPYMVEEGLYCKSSTYKANPQRCKAIRQATLEGWKIAFQDEKRTLEIVKKRCQKENITFNIVHQKRMLAVMKTIIFPDGEINTGIMNRKSFNQTCDIIKLDPGLVKYEQFVPDNQQ